MEAETSTFKRDGPKAWLSMIAAFCSFLVLGGMERSFGIWYVEILQRLRRSAAISAWIGGANTGIRFMLSPLVAVMCHKFPINYVAATGGIIFGTSVFMTAWVDTEVSLLLIYSIVGGIGASMVYLPPFISLADSFEKYRGFALAFALCGSGLGSLVFSFLFTFLFKNVSYFEAITIVSGIIFQTVVSGLLCVRCSGDDNQSLELRSELGSKMRRSSRHSFTYIHQTDTATNLHDNEELKSIMSRKNRYLDSSTKERKCQTTKFNYGLFVVPITWTLTLSAALFQFSSSPYNILIVDFARSRGIEETSAASIITANGATELFTRFPIGFILQHEMMTKYRFFIWSFLAIGSGVMAFVTVQCTELIEFVITASANAAFVGGFYTCGPLILNYYFNESSYADILGVYSFGIGVGTMFGSLISGLLVDVTQSYDLSYLVMGAESCIAAFFILLTYLLIKRYGESRKWYLKNI